MSLLLLHVLHVPVQNHLTPQINGSHPLHQCHNLICLSCLESAPGGVGDAAVSRLRSLEMADKRKQMQDQFDHRVLLLEQQEVLMLGLGGRLTASRRLSSRTFCTVISLNRPQPDYINNQINSGFGSKTVAPPNS